MVNMSAYVCMHPVCTTLPRAVKDIVQSEVPNALGNVIALHFRTTVHSEVCKQSVQNFISVDKCRDAAVSNYRR